jgi:hypothetical protein
VTLLWREVQVHDIYNFSSDFTENTSPLQYKQRSLRAVWFVVSHGISVLRQNAYISNVKTDGMYIYCLKMINPGIISDYTNA